MRKSLKNTKSKINKPQAVLIDWNGTLSPTNFWSHLEKSEKKSQRGFFKLWTDSLFINHKDKIVPWMRGEFTSEDIISLVSKDTNTGFNTILREFVIGCKLMEYSSPNIPKLVKDLRDKKVIVTIATNNMDCLTRWTVPFMKLDSLFDEILNSYYLKALKHDLDVKGKALFFKDFFCKYAIEPSNCIFIDDGEDKMNVISNLGIDFRKIGADKTLEQELRKILTNL
ncbi:MAG: hypothetical protein UT08_C0009G0035 [Candidatus Woesebacteria bacterium GW2011_GWB1_38_8]|uniref:Uncharacterized protein n=1 Tax=Candidatus Woesebacteria bacterium GW2011_GWB1_38_8 TaxID=1618570 RepID=A0A0G0P7D5_9BACT|nr:MAG: hypothetical protein UT08_C0009G0035 [Candidatus Woesebacteria bacterium GW2011_GWB1_38_8]